MAIQDRTNTGGAMKTKDSPIHNGKKNSTGTNQGGVLPPNNTIHNGTGEDGLRKIWKNHKSCSVDGDTKLEAEILTFIQSEKQKLLTELLESLPNGDTVGLFRKGEVFKLEDRPTDYVIGYETSITEVKSVIQRMMTAPKDNKKGK